ncbi:MAG: type II toxin-antitoxin system HipA family toxin [Mesorhizobium sp.]|uniref:type II toxin-antitoxin system HipA family toxin n=1 Tax=Mesorhizobium sp. TaxID=1871066 RepID=UPI000FE646F0|nr:HipA domain-containing protein [Mesorhizobium sp.]RWB85442.1 MAG: type II toxin-antitoxin system HipA family toxin [Mesorhizobium sp.]RWC97749.1 MAG: type II toxin-antitoxin system HipA family toxin [Mesorhizobium sp.]TIS61446.1 MAG: type II toxin-antitoxin system HipA family toxin [Mesorhizobium sp.]
MALHLVGENIDKTRSHYQAETGKLVQLMRGIYVDAGEDIEATILKHAVRIAKYLYPNAYLSAASAVLLGPTRDGRLFLSGRRIQRRRLRLLEIIQNAAPDHPSVAQAIVDDGMGEIRIDVSSMRQRFLEAFRLRSEHAASIDETMREAIANRLIEQYGSAQGAADATWALARANQWYREGEHAERFFLRPPLTTEPARNGAALDLIVAWHGAPLGNLTHDGFEWRWNADDQGPPLVRQTTPGKLPPFILSLLPEGWLESVLNDRDERATLRSGKRYMSNITIVERASDLSALPPDILLTRLNGFTRNTVFTGQYAGPGRGDLEQSFERNLAQIFERTDTPRLSGVQIKAPMFLSADGTLSPSIGRPFTHILKPAGTGGFEALPVIEWQSLALGSAAGFKTPATALVPMPDGMPPALLVERFDIRTSLEDKHLLALEDFCSVLGVPTEAKYDGTMERIARALRPLSTSPEEDVLLVLKRSLFAWLIADGDMHLKNMALLEIAEPGSTQFSSVRMAPLYDAVTTRVFPRLEKDRMALKLNGKDDRLRRADFKAFASTAGLTAADADTSIDDLVAALSRALNHLELPPPLSDGSQGAKMAEQMRAIVHERIEGFA